MKNLLKEDISFWEKDLQIEENKSIHIEKLIEVVKERSSDMDNVRLSPDSREVAVYISGYIVRKFNLRFMSCNNCDMVGNAAIESDDYAYLSTVNRGGLIFNIIDRLC